jgi:hypothetical protein
MQMNSIGEKYYYFKRMFKKNTKEPGQPSSIPSPTVKDKEQKPEPIISTSLSH